MTNDVSTQSFVSLVGSFHANDTEGSRRVPEDVYLTCPLVWIGTIFNTVSFLDYPVTLLLGSIVLNGPVMRQALQ